MPYCDNVWHIDAHENIPSPTCLIVFVESKTENQPAYQNVKLKCETVAATWDPRLYHSRPTWPPNSPYLNPVRGLQDMRSTAVTCFSEIC